VRAFASATDVAENVVFENFDFEPDVASNGHAPVTGRP
jgi:hypothetical protein